MLAIAAVLAAGTSGAAFAQCPPGYGWNGVQCAPAGAYAPNNPVSGAAAGAASGAAAGAAAAGPVGAVVGGALGTAAGTVAGTTNMVTGAPVATYGSSVPPPHSGGCAPGYVLYSGGCYPAR
jgi:hypothetical protein